MVVELRIDEHVRLWEEQEVVVHGHNLEEEQEGDSRGNVLDDSLDAVVVAVHVVAARLQVAAEDSCTVAAHPDRPGPRAVHEHRRASAAVDHSDLADHLDQLPGRAH